MSSIFLESENFHFDQNNDIPYQAKGLKRVQPEKSAENTTTHSLVHLLHTMKSSFLTRENDRSFLRQIILSQQGNNVMMLVKKAETTLLVGTDFSQFSLCGTEYQAFPDIRLAFSERKKLGGWILTHENFDVKIFFLILEALEFPKIFAPESVISMLRQAISHTEMQDKVRFSELFCTENIVHIGDITCVLSENNNSQYLGIRHENRIFSYDFFPLPASKIDGFFPSAPISLRENVFCIHTLSFSIGEIVQFSQSGISKNAMKFTFDTFFLNGNRIATKSGFLLSDREKMANSGVITCILEEDSHFRTLSGYIFIDSRGWVHTYETARFHKEMVKKIRKIYEQTVTQIPHIARSDLIQTLRTEMGKFAFSLTGKTPLIIPIIIDKKTF